MAAGAVLVVGGGIAGMSAAVEACEAGCEVVLVERSPWLGGQVARFHQYFPKLCPPRCGQEILLRRLRQGRGLTVLTDTDLVRLGGGPGAWRAQLVHRPRFVAPCCTGCGACAPACPVERADAFNLGIGTTKAIHRPHPLAWPEPWAIDGEACTRCGACVPACPVGAIRLGELERTSALTVQAVIFATGWEPPDARGLPGLAFGVHPDVVTNLMLERLAAPDGPTGGRLARPSDGGPIRSVAFVQCAGSRDEGHLRHCSAVCCMATLKQARYVRAAFPEAEIHVFAIDLRAPGRGELFLAENQRDSLFFVHKGEAAKVEPTPGGLAVEAEDVLGEGRVRREVSLVVLATGMLPASCGDPLPGGLSRDASGFLLPEQREAGIFAVGCAAGPADVAACARGAAAVALRALQACAGGRHA